MLILRSTAVEKESGQFTGRIAYEARSSQKLCEVGVNPGRSRMRRYRAALMLACCFAGLSVDRFSSQAATFNESNFQRPPSRIAGTPEAIIR